MLLVYTYVSIAGAATTALLLGPQGPLFAIAAMPIGGSLAVVACALLIIARRRNASAAPRAVIWESPRP